MDDSEHYEMFKLKNKEFTVTVDVSQMPCGLNGALYFVEMPRDGGMTGGNAAGAKYGTGYCDAQCPHDIKFIGGEANCDGWDPNPKDPNAGAGKYGSCCAEFDIWEANKISSAFTNHPCLHDGQKRCEGTECGDNASHERYQGTCDKDGCDLNAFRAGVEDFFGPGKTVDTNSPITVVTQFITSDGTDEGDLTEVRRFFVQNGQVHAHPQSDVPSLGGQYNSLTDEMCDAMKGAFGDVNDHKKKGGLKKMGESMANGHVLVMSIWDDHEADMLWLDSTSPATKTGKASGGPRGTCATSSGRPSDVESQHPHAHVTFSDIKFGEICSTFNCPGEEELIFTQ